jgi:hypothetical protein
MMMKTVTAAARDWREFNPRAYLDEYYADIGAENNALLRFFVEAYRGVSADSVLLDFGGGPTIHALIAAAPRVREIHLCDYLAANLEEVRLWLRGESGAFDWRPFVKTTLQLERGTPCSDEEAVQRENEIRVRVKHVTTCDLSLVMPLRGISCTYDIVTTNFCAESVTDQRLRWWVYLQRITSLLRPSGTLLLSALKGASGYSVGGRVFPAVNISEADLASALGVAGCDRDSIVITSVVADRPARRYHGLMFASARKERNRRFR